jgi:hypothetical protein
MAVLTGLERDELVELLTEAVSGGGAPRETLAQLLHESLRSQLEVNGLPSVLASRTVDICIRSDYFLDPPALRAVLDFLMAKGQTSVARLLARLDRRLPVRAGPMEALILSSRIPFANRASLRTILREMFTIDAAEPILVIKGEKDSGKSYISELVEHICVAMDQTIFCKFALEMDEQGQDATPLAIARDLVTQLGGDPSNYPPLNSNPDAWFPELANWVVAHANGAANGNARAWFVIDGLRSGVLQPETGRFLAALARKCALGIAAKRHRIVLSDFSDDHLEKLPRRMRRYVTEPITHNDIRAVVTEIIAASTMFPDAEKPALVDEALTRVLEGLTPPLSSTSLLGRRLETLIAGAGL